MQYPLHLPPGYRLRWDPDILTLCRSDDSVVARFNGVGARSNEIRKAADQDYLETLYNHEAPIPDAVTDQPCLQVRLFGHFEIVWNHEHVDLGRNSKALTIFKCLLADRDRRVSRDLLMSWIWPKFSLTKARASLNVAICTLRKLLRERSSGLQNYIWLENGYFCLCPTVRVVTDVEEFDFCYEEGRRMHKTNPIEGAAKYEKAIDLYQSDYLLEHLYEDWTMVERERLSLAYMDILEQLALYYHETEQFRESIRICYRILGRDRGHEQCHLLLTEGYALLGWYGRALHQYRLFKDILKSTCGTDPSAETDKRFRKILGRL